MQVDEQNTSTEKIVDKNIAQNKMLEKKASIERDMAAWGVRAYEMRSNWEREVEAHKETRRKAADERIAMAMEYNKQIEIMTKESTKQIERLTRHNEDMAKQWAEERERMTKQWAEERERMTKQWEKERGRFIAAAVMGSASKRARV